MKTSTLLLSAALALASTASSFGQVITFETMTAWTGARSTLLTNGAIVQTMKLPEETPAIHSMTWRFTTPTTVTATSSIEAYFVQWFPGDDPTTLDVVEQTGPTGSILWSQAITLPTYTGTYDLKLTPNLLTDASKSYAMILRGVNMSTGVQVANVDDSDAFIYGQNHRLASGATSFAALSGLSYTAPGFDWGFYQIVIADSILTPIPETGTVAIVFAGALVAGLGLRRRRHAESRAAFAAA